MKRKVIFSVLLILFVLAAAYGVTMAWFTDTDATNNIFTAGTLIIDADDEWTNADPLTGNWENANPGDCEPKEFTITNNGSKNMYVRFAFTGSWEPVLDFPNPHGIDLTGFTPDNDLVTVTPGPGFSNWTELEIGGVTYWFYNGILPPFDAANPLDHILTFTFNVCLDGPGTGNEYQGATYAASFTFDAIQVTHAASFDAWDAGFYDSATPAWHEVVEAGGVYSFVGGIPSAVPWEPTGSGEPNWEGWTYP